MAIQRVINNFDVLSLLQVFFMTQFRKFEDVAGRFKLFHKEENIFFENEKLRNEFFDLLSHKCKLCPLLKPMKTFRELELHMRRDHSLHYCDICVKDLKVSINNIENLVQL